MKSDSYSPENAETAMSRREQVRWIDRLAKRLLLHKLADIKYGRLTLIAGAQREVFGQLSPQCTLDITLRVHDAQTYSDVAFGGTVGSGEAYMAGSWECDDLTGLVRLLVINREVLDGLDSGAGKLMLPLNKLFHWLHRNNLKGSRRNIGAHYDLGNDMFKLFLDPTMMYSSGVFEHKDATMQEASEAKLKRICDKLLLSPEDHVVEIGTGWGGFAIYAAQNYGCKVTTTTISREQYEYAQEKVQAAGLSDKITLLLEDYRNLTGQYDKLVSIEMIEAVGHKWFDTYFKQCSKLLKPEGMMLLQAITIADQRYKVAKREVDFIQRYIFPGGCLPSVTEIGKSITKVSDMRVYHLDDIGPHYATTLLKWRERFMENWPQIRQLGYSDTFKRMWEFYLCYCEGGFEERAIGTVQMLMIKPGCRREAVV